MSSQELAKVKTYLQDKAIRNMNFCPKCNSELEENCLPFEEMTEGQQADYTAGWRDMYCPNCNCEIEDFVDVI